MDVYWSDVVKGLVKTTTFGFIFSTIACYKGFKAKGGAKGVGRSDYKCGGCGLLSILVGDFIITIFKVR